MELDIQLKLKSNLNYIKYIRENPIWYKKLNRNPLLFNDFINEVKDNYKLNTIDKLEHMINDINTLQAFIEILK